MVTRSSSGGSSGDDVRRLNADVISRLLSGAPQPLGEGGLALRVLQNRGRVSGQPRRTPVGVTQLNGWDYLVSPGPRRDWVRNLHTQPECALLAGDDVSHRRAVPVDGDEAAAAVATYLSAMQAPWAARSFPVAQDAGRAEITRHLDALAVFRLDPPDVAAS
jgi:deazaflavin-dependent oxidoreductase (nitroreductase family)